MNNEEYPVEISVVVPLYNEEESLPELQAWIDRVMKANGFTYEVIYVNDGSTDRSWEVIRQLSQEYPDAVHGVSFRRNYGKSPALHTGFGQGGDHDGRRPPGLPRRDSRALPDDNPGGV